MVAVASAAFQVGSGKEPGAVASGGRKKSPNDGCNTMQLETKSAQ